MLHKVVALLLILVFVLGMVGCMSHTHVVGNGAQGVSTQEARQWYVLFGLVPINDANSAMLAGNATDYTIKTEISPLDFIINIFTSWVTVYSRTVSVTR
jgi:hypothetical protein